MFWIDPSSGRILKSFLELSGEARLSGSAPKMDGRTPRTDERDDRTVETFTRVTVTYRPDVRLGILLPSAMAEEYQGLTLAQTTNQERVTRIRCRAVYSDFKRFETSGKVVIPKTER